MSHLITSLLVEAHQQCPRKAFFLLRRSPEPQPHEYELAVAEREAQRRIAYLNSASAQARRTPRGTDASAVIAFGDLEATCDVLTPGSKRGQCEPHLVLGTEKPSSLNKARLAFAGYVLGEKNRRRPSFGIIVPFVGDPKRVKLDLLYPAVSTAITRLRGWTRQLPADPPPLAMGKQCQTCEFRNHCRAEAEKSESLFLLDKMTPKVVAKYQKKGIFTLTQLSYVYRPRRRRKVAGKAPTPFNVELQALAIRTKKIYLHERPALAPHPVELFLDIEGIPDQGFDYLIGVLVKKGEKTTMYSLWADDTDAESRIFKECFALTAKHPGAPVYHYGSYERRAIGQVAERYGFDCTDLLARLVNVNAMIYGKVYFPTRSNRLKDLGAAVGASWPTPNPSGLESVAWRYRWEDSHQNDFKAKLIAYNRADCTALRLLTAELQTLSKEADSRPDVDFTTKPKQLSTPAGESIHRAFDGIITSAHEEYGRRRIRLTETPKGKRTADRDHRHYSRPCPVAQRHFPRRVSQTISVPRARKCPQRHKCGLLPTNVTTEHCIIDLAFTRSGCHKKIVRYRGRNAYCPSCERAYAPPAIRNRHAQIFGHALQAWAVYQRIVMRLPYMAISQSYELLFSEHINTSSLTTFVRRLAEEHAPTEHLLLKQILASRFVHVDETKLNIQRTTHYAWGVTDGRHVVFRLTPTRETTVVEKLLNGYGGVLVSDFYGGYDSFTCRQQKCLVHLIRDLNDDLWKNPFLAEYEVFVSRLRDLLVPIFEDVEKYGLKKRHLQKHRKSVDRFYHHSIDNVTWESDIIQTYQKRFTRYREALFLFLNEDDIPWNNNMGERALRHLAIQRKISGSFFLKGATDYLRLLGIAQSCRFQDKSFLRFLLSDDHDVDTFKDRKRRGRL